VFLQILVLIVLFSCEKGYEKSWFGKVSFNKEEVEVRDKSSFEILNHDYGKDDVSAYYRGFEIKGSDGKSFILLGKSYSKDKNNVYICSNYLDGTKYYTQRATDIYILEGEDPSQFVVLDEYFAKGNLHAYFGSSKLNLSHGPSFKSLGGGYGKDRENVYHDFSIMSADASTFRLLPSSMYAIDSKAVYYNGHEIADSDVSTFKVLSMKVCKDKNHVYELGKAVPGIDAKTYECFPGSDYAKDKNQVYYGTEIIKEADIETFTANKNTEYAKDKNNYYSWGEIEKPESLGYKNAVFEYK